MGNKWWTWELIPTNEEGAGTDTASTGEVSASETSTADTATETTETVEQSPVTEEGADQTAESLNTETTPATDTGKYQSKVPDSIPYARFHEVNEKRHQVASENAYLKSELSQLKQQVAALTQTQDPYAGVVKNDPALIAQYPMLKPIVDKLQEIDGRLKSDADEKTAKAESDRLESAINKLSGNYPALKEKFIRDYVANEWILNPKADLEMLAKQTNDWLSNRDKQTISGYVGKKKVDAGKGSVPNAGAPSAKAPTFPKTANLNQVFEMAENNALRGLGIKR
jgi:hypothetical protein